MTSTGPVAERRECLAAFGASAEVAEELLAYNENVFAQPLQDGGTRRPLGDEPFVEAWADYLAAAEGVDMATVLRSVLVQLAFPVAEGISQTDDYRAVVRRGEPATGKPLASGLPLRAPSRIGLRLQPTPAGRIPVVTVGDRGDFEDVLRALTARNEPVPVPASMGAVMIAGYSNWDRIRRHRATWMKDNPPQQWPCEFRRLVADKANYQDRFIVASEGPYSGVQAAELGLDEEAWNRISLDIRVHHECAHYATKRLFGSMRNNLLDELVADYAGLSGAVGEYRADWFLRFLGLERPGCYRSGGRLENYRGEPPLGDAAFEVLQALVRAAARNLERFDARRSATGGHASDVFLALTRLTIEELADVQAESRIAAAMNASLQEEFIGI